MLYVENITNVKVSLEVY